MTNKMKGVRFQLKNGAPIQDLKFGKSRESAVASSGELNANSKQDLLGQISKLMEQASAGNIVKTSTVEAKKERQQLVTAMVNDQSGETAYEIGVAIAAEISEAQAREGFLRRVTIEEPLSQGQHPRVRVRFPNVMGVVATGPAEISPQFLRDKYFWPPEFNIVANLEIEEREIAQATGDILDEKYNEGLQAIMVQEDLTWKRAADATVNTANPLTVIAGALTPTYLASIKELVDGWNLQGTQCLLAYDYWKDIATNANWLAAFDPVSQNEILLSGKLGQIYGLQISTDGFRPMTQRVLNAGDLYVVSQPEYHGAITTRGGVVPTPLNGPVNSRTTRGWFLSELISIAVVNNRSVAVARRS